MARFFLWFLIAWAILGLAFGLLMAAPDNPVVVLIMIALCTSAAVGAFWMMYMSVRHDRNPLPMVLLAMFVPFIFIGYYFERVRTGKYLTEGRSLQSADR